MPDRPTNDDMCEMCGCPFGIHYISFNGNRTGCLTDDQRDGRCECRGFAKVYRPKITVDYQHSSRGNEEMQSDLDYRYNGRSQSWSQH